LNNGCVCCTVRGDLIRILGELRERRDSGKLKFERVIIETTEWPIRGRSRRASSSTRKIGNYYLLDSVITLVDAKHAAKQLDGFRHEVGLGHENPVGKPDLLLASGTRRAASRRALRPPE